MEAKDLIRDSWPKIIAMLVCLTIAAIDVTDVPVFGNAWWPILYGGSAMCLLAWRIWWWRPLLVSFGALLFSASVARAFMRAFAERPQYAGTAINLLVAIYTFGYVRNRQNQENP